MHKIFPHFTAAAVLILCAWFAGAMPAQARSSAEIAAAFDAGVAAYDAGDYQKAFKIWWDLRYEDIAAMRNLGMMLRKGQGTPKDPKQAEELYLRAAEAGLPTAQADLADMYLKGELGAPDLARALPLLEAAAAANHPVAQFQLGQFYETGAPPLVPKDMETARQLYAAAAKHGMPEAAARSAYLGPPAVERALTASTPAASTPAASASAAGVPAPTPTSPAVPSAPDLRTKPLN
ncbi:MAG TPA: tetratricopeptide repeat protein [Rhizomicrobium sp.]|nr:tetratricopeptide repeat protein [Rhizomicrobium sp.]